MHNFTSGNWTDVDRAAAKIRLPTWTIMHCRINNREGISWFSGSAQPPKRRNHTNKPRTPDQLAADYGLPLDAVREAIEYGRSDPPEIAADIAREEAIVAASGQSTPEPEYISRPKILSAEEWARLLS